MSQTVESVNGGPPASAFRNNQPNVLGFDRVVSIGAGAVLAAWGIGARGPAGVGAAALGALLLARGTMRRDPIKHLLSPRPAAKTVAEEHGWKTAALTNRAVTINRPRIEVYEAWRDFDSLKTVLENIDAIQVLDDRRSRWIAKAPGGETVEWISEITEDEPGRRIAWRSSDDSAIKTVGEIDFEDAFDGRSCVVRASIAYEPPAGELGRIIAALFQKEPVMQARRDLRRFKQVLETGEVATSARTRAAVAAT